MKRLDSSWFLDCLRAVLYPLHWALPCVDRVPRAIGHDLGSGVVVPLSRLPLKRGDGAAPNRCFGEPVDPSVVVVDLDAKEIDYGLKLHAAALRWPPKHTGTTLLRRAVGHWRCLSSEGVSIRDVFAQLVASVLEGHRACLNLQRGTRKPL